MTIASEIERLQCAKADIKTAIENKGVTVGSSDTIDCYSACIDAIESGGEDGMFVDVLVIGGGGAGGNGTGHYGGGGGGGGGGFVEREHYWLPGKGAGVVVGAGGTPYTGSCSLRPGNDGGDSFFGEIAAYGGGGGGAENYFANNGGSGGGASSSSYDNTYPRLPGEAIEGQGNAGGINHAYCIGGGGGGAGNGASQYTGQGGSGRTPSIIDCGIVFSSGGGGGIGASNCSTVPPFGGVCGGRGGGGGCCGGNAISCGSGGGGGGGIASSVNNCVASLGGCGACGIVYVRYRTDGSCGNKCAMCGGTKSVIAVNGVSYCLHTFTSNGVFYEDNGCRKVKYLVVGGGAGGGQMYYSNCATAYGGGGGGAVKAGIMNIDSICTSVKVGCGGAGAKYNTNAGNGGDSCFGEIIAKGGKPGVKGGCCLLYGIGGTSGSGKRGGFPLGYCSPSCIYLPTQPTGGGGGAGSSGMQLKGCNDKNYILWNTEGGRGLYGYGGGGNGMTSSTCGLKSRDGGGVCYQSPNATNCGGGGGTGCTCGGNGSTGLVEVCYPVDGSWGICEAVGGSRTVVTDGGVNYCRHRFTSASTFTFCIIC